MYSSCGIRRLKDITCGTEIQKCKGVARILAWFGGEMSKAESSSRLDPLASLMPLELELPIESKVLLAFLFTNLIFESGKMLALLFPTTLPD